MVISWKINRISRKLSDVLKIVDILEQNSTSFNSYSEQFDNSTPAGKMQMCAKAKAGEWCGGRVLGYDLVPVENQDGTKRRKTKLTINQIEARSVRLIFKKCWCK